MPRVRTILLPVVVVGLAIAGWSLVWHWGANRAEDLVQRWLASEAANGRVIQCGERTRGGYPFRMEITCTRPVVDIRDEARPYQTYRFERLHIVSQIWDPGHVIAEATGPVVISTEGDPTVTTANWRLLQASARLAIDRYDSTSAQAEALEVTRNGDVLLRANRAELHTRPHPSDPVSIDVVSRLVSARFGEQVAAPVDAEIQLILRRLLRSPNMPLPLTPRQWKAAGGSVDVVLLRLSQGDALGVARGNLRLTPEGKPEGEIELRLANAEAAIQASGLGATLGPVAAGALTLASRPADVEGRPGRVMTLRASDGRLQIGPVRIPLPTILP
ncbi:MAG: DUF2125 domain-containing protein [Phreatobacter sp.]